jgi:SAM-dependent methyltransferase
MFGNVNHSNAMTFMIPDWQLPPGTDRGLWDYVHNDLLARSYDEKLAGTPLLAADLRFVQKHFAKPGRLIDLGCGTGRLLIPFAHQGFDCLGVDLSDAMLEVVAEKARRERLTIPCLKANLVELDAVADRSFDYATCLFSTLGMIRGEQNRRRFLAHVFRLLQPGGEFVLHVHNRHFRFGRGSGKKGKERGDRTMPQAYGGAELTLHHFTRAEIGRELRRAGFAIREFKPVGLSETGELLWPKIFSSIRAYGFLIAAVKVQSWSPQAALFRANELVPPRSSCRRDATAPADCRRPGLSPHHQIGATSL